MKKKQSCEKNVSFSAAASFMQMPCLEQICKDVSLPAKKRKEEKRRHLVKQTYPYGAQYIFIIYTFAFIPANELLLWRIFNWLQSRSHSSALQSRYKTLVTHKTGTFTFLQPWIPQHTPKICKDQHVYLKVLASLLLGQRIQAHSRHFIEDLESQISGFCDKGMEWRVRRLYLTDPSPWIIVASNCHFELNRQTTFESSAEFWVFCSLLQNNSTLKIKNRDNLHRPLEPLGNIAVVTNWIRL